MKRWRRISQVILASLLAVLLPTLVVMAQQMLVPGGNSSKPGLGFSNDSQQDTGLYRSEENALSVVTGAIERWRVNNSGHLLPGADNVYDIGDSAANRVGNVAVAGNLHVVGSLVHVTAQIRMGDGTSGAPALAFLQYPNTGLYRTGSPGVGIAVGGASAGFDFRSNGDFVSTVHAGSGLGSATSMWENLFSLAWTGWVFSGAQSSPATKQVLFYIRDDVNQDGAVTNDCVLRARLQSGVEVHIATLVLDGTCP